MVQAEPEPALTVSYIKKEGLKPTLKCGEGAPPPDPNWRMVPQ